VHPPGSFGGAGARGSDGSGGGPGIETSEKHSRLSVGGGPGIGIFGEAAFQAIRQRALRAVERAELALKVGGRIEEEGGHGHGQGF